MSIDIVLFLAFVLDNVVPYISLTYALLTSFTVLLCHKAGLYRIIMHGFSLLPSLAFSITSPVITKMGLAIFSALARLLAAKTLQSLWTQSFASTVFESSLLQSVQQSTCGSRQYHYRLVTS